MNILFVIEADWLAGLVFDAQFVAEALSLFGHQVYAIDYGNRRGREGFLGLGSLKTKEFPGIARAFSQASVCLRSPGFIRIPGLGRISAAFTHYREMAKTIVEKNINVIVLYSVPTNGLQAIYLARKLNIPIVYRSMELHHRLVRYHLARPLIMVLERMVYSRVDAVLSIIPQLSRYAVNMGAPESKVKLLLFPADTKLFQPDVDCSKIRQKWGLSEKDIVIVFTGVLWEFSGLDGFICQFPEVLRWIPKAKLLIVGDGPQRYKLERIIAEVGLEKQVIITGFQPYETMPQYINLATICINPFLFTEATKGSFPSKIIQYAACGKATIATALPGTTAVLPGECCGVVYADNMTDLVKEVTSLLKSPEHRKQLGNAGLNYVKEVHSYEKVAHRFETILEAVIEQKRRERTSKQI